MLGIKPTSGRAELVVKNYRCFSDEAPFRIRLDAGVTALVGPNNSGKSAVGRLVYEFQALWQVLGSRNFLPHLMDSGHLNGIGGPRGVADAGEIYFNGNDRPLSISFNFEGAMQDPEYNVPTIASLELVLDRASSNWTGAIRLSDRTVHPGSGASGWDADPSRSVILHQGQVIARDPGVAAASRVLAGAVLIPSDRTLSASASGDNFDSRFGRAALEFHRGWKGGAAKSQTRAILALDSTLGSAFGFNQLNILAGNDNEFQFVIDGQPYRRHEVGAGLAHFLYCAIALLDKKPTLIFIDEPESGLHPKLQLALLEYLEKQSEGALVFTTHSVGLARLCSDQVLSFQKKGAHTIVKPLDEVLSMAEFLGEMSYSSWRELGATTLLVVEGPTELRTIRQFLRVLKLEGAVAIVHAGGSALIAEDKADQLHEISRLASSIAVLIDSERDAEGQELSDGRKKFIENCKTLGFSVHVTKFRSTENYLSERAISSHFGKQVRCLTPFEKLSDHPSPWSKRANWRIAALMSAGEIEHTDVGEFLLSIAV